MNRTLISVAACILCIAAPVSADLTVGFGLSLSFGGGKAETGAGVRVFSNDEEDKFAATVGLDYMLQSKRLRPTVGAAYLGDNAYIGLDLGFDLDGGDVDFGVGIGGVNTRDQSTDQDDGEFDPDGDEF